MAYILSQIEQSHPQAGDQFLPVVRDDLMKRFKLDLLTIDLNQMNEKIFYARDQASKPKSGKPLRATSEREIRVGWR